MPGERPPPPRYCTRCGHFIVERYIESEARRRFCCESCGAIHYENPRVVSSVIVEHGGRTLLQQRAMDPRRGYWTFPGGFLEVGETPEEGALREAKEEVGLEVALTGLQGVYARTDAGIVLVVYTGISASDAAFVGDAESTDVRWYASDDIPWADLAFDTTEAALRDWIRNRSSSPLA